MRLNDKLDRVKSVAGTVHIYLDGIPASSAFGEEILFIFFRYAYSGIFYGKDYFSIFSFKADGNFPLPGVFQRVFNQIIYGFIEPERITQDIISFILDTRFKHKAFGFYRAFFIG